MATESPMRLVGNSGVGKWAPSNNPDALAFNNMGAEELGFLMKGYDQKDQVPNRSGSAPPTIEGAFVAAGNIMAQKNSGLIPTLAGLSSSFENCDSEEQLCSDPAYFAYYSSKINLNPRLAPPLLSREKRRLARHMGGFGNNRRSNRANDSTDRRPHCSQNSLSAQMEGLQDDKLHSKASGGWAVTNSSRSSSNSSASSAGPYSTLVDPKQVGLPGPSSTVYNHPSTTVTREEQIDRDIQASILDDPSIDMPQLVESIQSSAKVSVEDADIIRMISSTEPSATSFPSLLYSDGTHQRSNTTNKGTSFENSPSTSSATESDLSTLDSRMRALNVSSGPDGDNGKQWQVHQQSYDRNIPQKHGTATAYLVQGVQPQMVSQGFNNSCIGVDKFGHQFSNLSSGDVHQVPHSPGLTPPLYATVAAYMTSGQPFYSNLQTADLYASQFNMNGCAIASAVYPQFMGGYHSQNLIRMPFSGSSSNSFNDQTAGIATGEGLPHVGDYQHLSRIYGNHGLMLQPSYMDSVHMQYLQPYLEGAYGAPGQYGSPGQYGGLMPRGNIGSQVDSFVWQKESPYMSDPKFQVPPNGSLNNSIPQKGGTMGTSYYRSSPSVGVILPFPVTSIASPVLPGFQEGGTSHPEQRVEMRFPQGCLRNTGVYSGWQGQRRGDGPDDLKKHSFLEELKASNTRKFELPDIAGRIVEFSVDQHGSRFIQQKLETCGAEEKESVFKEVLPHASKLMTDVFGNYVIQKFFEHGSREQRKELANQLSGQMVSLSLQMYGCRVIQKALEVIELDQKVHLIHELDGHVMRCVRDQNGNHVIQKCIECIPAGKIGFIIDAFRGQVASLSTHPYGCRVIQRVLEYCSDELQSQCIVDEILESACILAQDQYGNYVTQHVLGRGKPHERNRIIAKFAGNIVQMSQHKYASNVIEKLLEHGDTSEREFLIDEIIGHPDENNLLVMMKDQFANYVVQKILETCNDKQREMLLKRVRCHLNALKKYTYGKHIVARFEQVCGEEDS